MKMIAVQRASEKWMCGKIKKWTAPKREELESVSSEGEASKKN